MTGAGAAATGLLVAACVAGLAVGLTVERAAVLTGLAATGLTVVLEAVAVLAVVAFGVAAGRAAVLLWARAGALVSAQKRRAEVKCVFIELGKLSSE